MCATDKHNKTTHVSVCENCRLRSSPLPRSNIPWTVKTTMTNWVLSGQLVIQHTLQFRGSFPLGEWEQQLLAGSIDWGSNNEVTQALPCHYVLISDTELDDLTNSASRKQWWDLTVCTSQRAKTVSAGEKNIAWDGKNGKGVTYSKSATFSGPLVKT